MADPQNDADKIRLKRLERLQAATQSSSGASSSTSPSATPLPEPSSGSPSASSSAAAARSSSALATPVSSGKSVETSKRPLSSTALSSENGETRIPVAVSARKDGISSPSIRNSAASKPIVQGGNTPISGSTSAGSDAALRIPYPLWFSGVVSRVFNFTLSQQRAESSNWSVTYLYTLHEELVSEQQQRQGEASTSETRFTEDNLERAIVARLSMDASQLADQEDVEMEDESESNTTDPAVRLTVLAGLPQQTTNLEYLIGCWKRLPVERQRIGQPKSASDDAAKRLQALDFIKRKVVEGIGLQLQEPELFPQPPNKLLGGAELLPPLLQSSSYPTTPQLSMDSHQILALLADIAAIYTTPTSSADLVDVLGTPVLQSLISKLSAKQSSIQGLLAAMGAPASSTEGVLDLTGIEWRNVVRGVVEMSDVKSIANMFPEMPNWCPAGAPAQTFETEALLGPLLRLGCFADAFPSVGKAYFAQPSALSREAIEASSNALRGTLNSLQSLLFSIFNNIVRSSPASREHVLALFAHVLEINTKRDGMRVDRRTVSSDGFMINTFSVLMGLAAPFMDLSFSKIDKIDAEYFRKCRGRIDIKEVTKIHATGDEAKEYYNDYAMTDSSPPPNFISEVFFLATGYFHYALYPAFSYHESIQRHLRNLQEDLQDAESNRQFDGTPQEAGYRQQVERMKAELDAWKSRVHAAEVQLLDPGFIARVATFSNFVMTWLVRLVDPKGRHPAESIQLGSLPEETPLAFRMLPEYLVEDVTEFYFFISRYAPQNMLEVQKDQLLTFIIVFLNTPYVNNPYLKGKFVEILYRNTRSWGPRYPRGTMGDVINFHPLALKGLLPALMTVYCQIEFTGQHNQFYEKFEVRHQIAKILKLIWETREHREAFKAETNREGFVRFVNYLLNDATFLLDEALSKLVTIHDIQQEMADKATWDAQTDEQKKDREKLFKQAEGMASSFLIYTYEVLHLLKTLTAEAPEPFLMGEIVDRLAASLDFNLNVLAGPRCQELRVQDKEKYRFRPRELLSDILQIIINLGNREAYVAATAKDGRSYSKGLFDNAMRIAARAGIKGDQQLLVLRSLVERVEAIREAEAAEEELGETPDDYLDPLTAEIMVDPVTLPASGINIDFNTIKQHLLTVQQDPFNRTPLKIEDIKRNDQLRGEIEAFRRQRKEERLSKMREAVQPAE